MTNAYATARSRTLLALRSAVTVLIVLIASTSCSSGGTGAVSGDVVTIVGVDVPLSFEPAEVELAAGRYTIRFRNDGMLPHQLAIGSPDDDGDYPDGDTREVVGGAERSFEVTLEPGRRAFACYVDRHNEAGMTGTLIVT